MVVRRWGPGNPLWEWKRKHGKLKGHSRKRRAVRRSVRHVRVDSMARRRYGRRRGRSRGGMGRLFSQKNLMYTIGAIFLLPKFASVSPQIAGALGGFMGAGPIGAAAGYFAAPTISNMVGGAAGGSGVVLG